MRVAGKWDHQTKEDEMLQAQLEWDEIKRQKVKRETRKVKR